MGGGASKSRQRQDPVVEFPSETKASLQLQQQQQSQYQEDPAEEVQTVQPASSKRSSGEVLRDASLQSHKDRVIDWESINSPALRSALPMLVELERERRCDHWMWRPIHYAALHGLTGAMEALVKMGANIDARTGGHAPPGKPLSRSTFNFTAEVECEGQGVIVEEVDGDSLVVARPPSMQRRRVPMSSCVCTGYTQVQHSMHTRHFAYATALHIAIEFKHIGAVQALLSLRADPNTSWNDERDIPLHKAIAQGHNEAVEVLLMHKADPNTECCWGHFPLATAALCSQEPSRAVAQMLLEAGARRGVTDKSGKTAAQLAREAGHDVFADTVESYQVGAQQRSATPVQKMLPDPPQLAGERHDPPGPPPPVAPTGPPPEPPPGTAHLRELL